LGGSEVSLLEMVGAYAPFSNGGCRVIPYGYLGVIDSEGDIHAWNDHPKIPAIAQKPLNTMRGLLRKVVTSGTGKLANWIPNAAGKTGTGDNNHDAWFIGYTEHQVTGVWIIVGPSLK
jgi:penicillin-binding protein 1A